MISCKGNFNKPVPEPAMPKIVISGKDFKTEDGEPFRVWGFNISGADNDMLEDRWEEEVIMMKLRENFKEMKELGANFVRIALQYNKFMKDPENPNKEALTRLKRLVTFAEENKLYLAINGLGAFRKEDQPDWYNAMNEAERWATQRVFWRSVAATVRESPAVIFYDLMNEPVAGVNVDNGWLPSEKPFGGYYFVQNITLDLKGRTTHEVIGQWIDTLTQAIREVDVKTPITVGFLGFPGLVNLSPHLDFLSIHIYPKSGEMEKFADIIQKFQTDKPLLIEEIAPMNCSSKELRTFIIENNPYVTGWVNHYFGKTIEELTPPATIAEAIWKDWYETFEEMSAQQK